MFDANCQIQTGRYKNNMIFTKLFCVQLYGYPVRGIFYCMVGCRVQGDETDILFLKRSTIASLCKV